MKKIIDDDIKEDWMKIENYVNPDKSLDLKFILEHVLEMKKLLLEYKTKIKYYNKHKLNTNYLHGKLVRLMERAIAIKEETAKSYIYKKIDNINNDKNNDDENNANKNNDNKSDNTKKTDDNKYKFENCDRIAKYRKLKVGNCHLKYTEYEYCQYHRPKNSINENFPYKSISNKINIPSLVKYLSLKPDHLLQDTIRHCIMLTYNSLENIR